ncbi:putative hydroxypyruvate isomerase [Aphelenchoides fujianensis]|nr:putative hydroxypyruvate isomerase [Aphelenchoides fujianensis]
MFKSRPLLERYRLAREFGFKLVEVPFCFSESADALREAADSNGLQHVLINAKLDEQIGGLACRGDRREQFRDYLELSVDYAKKLGCSIVHVMAGDGDPAKDEETFVENIRLAGRQLAEHNILCVIEPLNSHSFPNYFLRSFEQAQRIVTKLDEPNVKILFDVFHCQLLHGQLTHWLTTLAPLIGHIQVSQPPNRNEPNTPGEVNFDYFFQLLRDTRPDLLIGAEYFETKENADWVQQYGLSF